MASANLWVTHRVLKTVLGTSYFSVNLFAIDVDIDVFSHDSVGPLFNKTIELRSVEVKCVHSRTDQLAVIEYGMWFIIYSL